MDWFDLDRLEAFARNLLLQLGRATGLPLTGRDWELAAAAIVMLIALLLWTWPTRRAFRLGSPLRWLVVGLNLGSLAFWPIWVFALILSGIRRSTTPATTARPALPRTASAPANPVPAMLLNALKTLARATANRSSGDSKTTVGPWGKQPRPTTAAAATPTAQLATRAAPRALAPVARPAAQRPAAASVKRSSALPNRETWIRRR